MLQLTFGHSVSIFCFDCGLGNAPDDMVALSTRSHALYTYVKDETMLRDAISGCLGSLQSTSHHNVKLKFTLPDGLPAKIIRIMGVTESTLERCERTAEATLGDLRFGDRRGKLRFLCYNCSAKPLKLLAGSTPWLLGQDCCLH